MRFGKSQRINLEKTCIRNRISCYDDDDDDDVLPTSLHGAKTQNIIITAEKTVHVAVLINK
jgi:hypothetical protein